MKKFNVPEIEFIELSNDDIITASNCPPYTCTNYLCTECAECNGAYTCNIYDVK